MVCKFVKIACKLHISCDLQLQHKHCKQKQNAVYLPALL